jgi:serine protease Do
MNAIVFLTLVSAADPSIGKLEADRAAVIAKIRPAVVCVCGYGGTVSGSGVLIDPRGYVLTNYHVTESISPVMSGGLPDGLLYDAVIVGHDRIGDVALIKLLPKKDGQPFPFVNLGNSDLVKPGDWSLAMGNPFGLSQDFTPTVTYGLVSGVNRFQPPGGGRLLEYTDCIQIETSINPGNSGGPLFNMNGELIGINGRGSFEKRGRVNSGVGYAISVNQIKNFLGHLYAGWDVDHATLGARVETASEDGDLSKVLVNQVLDESDAYRRGILAKDQFIRFAGRPVTSANQYKNVLGIYPKGWRLPVTIRRENKTQDVLVRLMGLLDVPKDEEAQPKAPNQPRQPKPPADPLAQKAKQSPAMKLFKEKKGFANYFFADLETKRLYGEFIGAKETPAADRKANPDAPNDYGPFNTNLLIDGTFDRGDRKGDFSMTFKETAESGTTVGLKMGDVIETVTPLKENQSKGELTLPVGSGGLMLAMYHYRRLMGLGEKGFEGTFVNGGFEPYYPPSADGKPVEDWAARRVECEVIIGRHAAVETKFYFDRQSKHLLGLETSNAKDDDPCEVSFSEYKVVDGRMLPHRMDFVTADRRYAVFRVNKFTFNIK